MNVLGDWKIGQFLTGGEDHKLIWKDAQAEINNPDADPDNLKMLASTIKFCDDGVLKMYMPIPEGASQEDIDAAIAAGEIQIEDGKMLVEESKWKEENGKLYTYTGIEGELLGEVTSPWEEIKFDGDMIEIMVYKFIRI